MKRFAILLSAAVLAALPAQGQSGPAVLCQGTYALCIKAPCTLIPTLDGSGKYATERASCSCDVVKGWSMGPASCEQRQEHTAGGRTFLMSTYSNLYNREESTLFCKDPATVWAWCYGSPCVVDPENPKKATCNCPVQQGPAMTLGGSCRQEACKLVWSAASPAEDSFANNHFFETMKSEHPDWPTQPPAVQCDAIVREGKSGKPGR